MTEWVLPPDEAPVFVGLLEEARENKRPEARYLRGGFWRNYAARYREINELHKQMLRASEKVEAMRSGPTLSRAIDHLYQGQSNDCYWHGLFGGIYIVHMRMATLSHLIAAEDLADAAEAAAGGRPYGARLADTDLDAIDEVLVTTPGQTVVVDLAEGAGISSWDLRAVRVALASVLRRRPEAYHERLVARDREAEVAALGDAAGADAVAAAAGGPKSIHDSVISKEPGLAAFLRYDRHERRSGIVHLLPAGGGTVGGDFAGATYLELGDFVDDAFVLDTLSDGRVAARRTGSVVVDGAPQPLLVEKTFRFGGGRADPILELTTTVASRADRPLEFELAIEWNVNLLGGGHNPAAYYEAPDGGRTSHDAAGSRENASSVAFGNDFEGVRIEASIEPAADLTWYPVETVSNSEGGFERSYQGSSLLFRWPVALAAGEERTYALTFAAHQTRDRAGEEAR
jgi:4-alpha-glucanotransferase